MSEPVVTGGCLCGAVRYSAGEPPVMARICWCRICQHVTGGNSSVNVFFHRDGFEIQGEVRWYDKAGDSGNVVSRGFCPTCGAPLFAENAARPEFIVARAGSLDDPDAIAPSATIWTSEAPEWALIHSDIPQVEKQPPPIS